jgi:hypothetical protein
LVLASDFQECGAATPVSAREAARRLVPALNDLGARRYPQLAIHALTAVGRDIGGGRAPA